MKQIKHITAINFLVLLGTLACIKFIAVSQAVYAYLIPVLILTTVNLFIAVFYFSRSKKTVARSFILSGLIVLVVGTSSCVSIVPRKKKPKQEKPVKAIPDGVDVAMATYPAALENRKGTIQHAYRTTSATVTIQLFEYANVDGDTSSLYFNNEWLIRDYAVVKEKKEFTIDLKAGENDLMLFAESLGTTPPNTAAINIIDGDKQKLFILNSDYGHCGALRFYRE